jgi:hypothetical protein
MLARPKYPPRKAANQESERSLLRLSVIERDGYHSSLPLLLDWMPMEEIGLRIATVTKISVSILHTVCIGKRNERDRRRR